MWYNTLDNQFSTERHTVPEYDREIQLPRPRAAAWNKGEQIMENNVRKKRIFSGIQPSGDLTLGSYMGAIKNWVAL